MQKVVLDCMAKDYANELLYCVSIHLNIKHVFLNQSQSFFFLIANITYSLDFGQLLVCPVHPSSAIDV